MTSITPILETSSPDVRGKIILLSSENGIDVFRVSVIFPDDTVPKPVTVRWNEEFLDILHIWTPTSGRCLDIQQWFGPRIVHSDFCSGVPVLTSIGKNGRNTATVTVSDVCSPITVSLGAKNSTRGENLAAYKVTFFVRPCRPVKEYTADIRIDRRPISFHEAVLSIYPWWNNYGYTLAPCPSAAEDPLYSTWYSCYQSPMGKDILADLAVAAEAGFKTVILDDGWQFEGKSKGDYSSCGNWNVAKDKFPDFNAFTDGVHALGMKLMVWFATPFVGYDTPQYSKFLGKYLSKNDGLRCAVLDPRYTEVRKFIKDTYKRFLREYDIDGLKLDFVDAFHPGDLASPFCADNGMDCEFVEDAVKLLLKEITEELAAVKSDLLYEYRQNYIGPAINRFGNMLRVGDCAYDALTNRIGMVNLRLMGYPIAIHSDMLCWSPSENAKICAKQLLNVLFCVPQISVFLADITADQKRVLKYFLNYWTANKDTLLHGEFCALHPEYNYTYICAESDRKLIAVIYNDTPFTFTGKPCDVHLNGSRDGLIFENTTDRVLFGEIYNCFGELTETVEIPANAIVRLPVPETGMLQCR